MNEPHSKYVRAVIRHLEDLYIINAVYQQSKNMVFVLQPRYNPSQSKTILIDRMNLAGYSYELDGPETELVLAVDPKATYKIPKLNIILFFLTLLSVYLVPVYIEELYGLNYSSFINDNANTWIVFTYLSGTINYFMAAISPTLDALATGKGIVFTLAMISILFVHEMGHYIASRRRNIITSWPYFIPAPNIIGTFGAVIKSKSPFWNRRDLIEVGAAGPIAGWVVALIWLIIGLQSSEIMPSGSVATDGFNLQLGPSLLTVLLGNLIIGPIPDNYVFTMNEAAFAGWVGLLVTAINMLPIGSLDGGHIVYGLLRQKQKIVGIVFMGVLILLGLSSPIWWFFAGFGLFFGIQHPPTLLDSQPPSRASVIMGIAAIIIFILSFTPIPFVSI